MKSDPIVQETRLARAALFADCGEDLDRLMDRLEASEEKDRRKVVTLEELRRSHPAKAPRR